ncbi:hypothetical protein ABTY98_21785 [Streptomyces sp. NPDC096040]|uniref:hypothetical protein n=1 Tax=Streptomyces sp. NPDC096040 TaxID=3155541 RepID=UPI003332C876
MAEQLAAGDLRQCAHLSRGRCGAGYVRGTEGYGRCLDCHMERVVAETVQGMLDGDIGAECGRCNGAVDPALLRPVAVELGSWVLVAGLCPVCAAVLLHEGQSSAAGGVR